MLPFKTILNLDKTAKATLFLQIANGLMAVWAKFDPSVSLPILSEKAFLKGLKINNGTMYNTDNVILNSMRLGFASINEREIEQGIELLKKILE